ncbi:MAG: hypothetical protein JSV80_14325 [Acidobacteriota bacterium]|nr:MAG: hypothetical protein JSV80_14325 [Acidobacteriota bacterium]
MTPFQHRCRERLERLMAERGLDAVFTGLPAHPDRTVQAEDQSGHLRADVAGPRGVIELYLYRREAGFKVEGNWYVFERQRFAGETQLLEALVRALEPWLA